MITVCDYITKTKQLSALQALSYKINYVNGVNTMKEIFLHWSTLLHVYSHQSKRFAFLPTLKFYNLNCPSSILKQQRKLFLFYQFIYLISLVLFIMNLYVEQKHKMCIRIQNITFHFKATEIRGKICCNLPLSHY